MSFHFLNAKQLFASMHWEEIMLDSAYQHLKTHVTKNWDTVPEKDTTKWTEMFAAFDAIPTRQVSRWSGGNISKAVVGVGTFATKSPHNDEFPDNYAQWGWEQVEKINPHCRMISQWIEKHRLGITAPTDAIKRVLKWKQRLDNGEYILKVFDPIEVLAEAESFAIYIPAANGGGGFLDGRGYGGAPLAGARMFETAGSAYTTISSRGLRDAVVVNVKSNLLGLDSKNATSKNCEDILGAVALMERRRLEQALEEASIEQLRTHLARLEAQVASNNAETNATGNEDEAPKKRRM